MLGNLFGDEEEDGLSSALSQSAAEALAAKIAVDAPAAGRAACGYVGLENQGATCYLNSLLQALYMNPDFRRQFFHIDPVQELSADLADKEAKEKARREQEKAEAEKKGKTGGGGKKKKEAPVQVDETVVTQLQGLGFPPNGARRAVLETKNKGFDIALDWCFANSEKPGFDDPLPGMEEEDEGKEVAADAVPRKQRKRRKLPIMAIELQRLFARLQLADQRAVSTADLTSRGFNFSGSDASVQHDVHELITKLLDALEQNLARTSGSKLVPALFEGKKRAQLRCLTCGHISGPPPELFRTLMLQVKGFPNLEASLKDGEFEVEKRETDCDSCGMKRAKEFVNVMHHLPPLLWTSLNRFELNYATGERKKVVDKFEFPLLLDLAPYVPRAAQPAGADHGHTTSSEAAPGGGLEDGDPLLGPSRSVGLGDAWREAVKDAFAAPPPSPAAAEGKPPTPPSEDQDSESVESEGDDPPVADPQPGVAGVGSGGGPRGPSLAREGDQDPLLYDLVGIVLHSGSGYSGHYISLIRDQVLDSHWKAEDLAGFSVKTKASRVASETRPQAGNSSGASTAPAGGKALPELPREQLAALDPDKLIAYILARAPLDSDLKAHAMRTDLVVTRIKDLTGLAWGKKFKKTHGSFKNFISTPFEDFYHNPRSDQLVLISGTEEEQAPSPEEGSTAEPGAKAEESCEGAAGFTEAEAATAEATAAVAAATEAADVAATTSKQDGWTTVQRKTRSSKGKKAEAGARESGGGGRDDFEAQWKAQEQQQLALYSKVEELAAERWGRWFRFDDSAVRALSLKELEDAFAGRQSAYMLLYRSRALGPLPTTAMAPTHGDLPPPLVPPAYWQEAIDRENKELQGDRDRYEAAASKFILEVLCPSHVQPVGPHLLPTFNLIEHLEHRGEAAAQSEAAAAATAGVEEAAGLGLPTQGEGGGGVEAPLSGAQKDPSRPICLELDLGTTSLDFRKQILAELAPHLGALGLPSSPEALRIDRLEAHGPGFFLVDEIASMPPDGKEDDGSAVWAAGLGLDHGSRILVWNGQDLGGVAPVLGDGFPPLGVLLTVLDAVAPEVPDPTAPSATPAAPPRTRAGRKRAATKGPEVEVVRNKEELFLRQANTLEDLLMQCSRETGIPLDRLVLHLVNQGRSGAKCTPLYVPPSLARGGQRVASIRLAKALVELEVSEGIEILVEDSEARGFHSTSLAEVELERRRHRRTIFIENRVTEEKNEGEDLSGAGEKDAATGEASKEPAVFEAVVDGDLILRDLRVQALQHFELDVGALSAATRLRFGAAHGGDLLNVEDKNVDENKVEDGFRLVLERGVVAGEGEVTVKICVVTGNDPNPKWSPLRPGTRGTVVELTVSEHITVQILKEEACAIAGLDGGEAGGRRLRFTNWLEEAGELVPEVQEVGFGEPLSYLSLKEAGLPSPDVLLLEEGRTPRAGEVMLHITAWLPSPSEGSPVASPQDQVGEPDAGADQETRLYTSFVMARHAAVKPVVSVMIHVEQTSGELYREVQRALHEAAVAHRETGTTAAEPAWSEELQAYLASSLTKAAMDDPRHHPWNLFRLRELRPDYLPGKTLAPPEDEDLISISGLTEDNGRIGGKTLAKLNIKGSRPLVLVPVDAAPPLPEGRGLDLWVQRHSVPTLFPDASMNGAAAPQDPTALPVQTEQPKWPPTRCLVAPEEGSVISLEDLQTTVARVGVVDPEHAILAKQDYSKHTWTVLTRTMQPPKSKKGKGSKAKINHGRDVKQAPYNVRDGDLIAVLDRREDLGAFFALNGTLPKWQAFDTPVDRIARDRALADKVAKDKPKSKAGKGKSGKKQRRAEVDLNIGGGFLSMEFSDDEEADEEDGGGSEGEL